MKRQTKKELEAIEKAFAMGKREGRTEVIEEIIQLLKLDDRYAFRSHSHYGEDRSPATMYL